MANSVEAVRAFSREVGLPVVIATRMFLEGELDLTGAHIPLHPSIYRPQLRELAAEGIDPVAVGAAFEAATPTVELIDVERSNREGAAFGLTLVLYLLTVVLTGQVATGVAIEKSNRISEVLLAIVPPRSMLIGKVLGVSESRVYQLHTQAMGRLRNHLRDQGAAPRAA